MIFHKKTLIHVIIPKCLYSNIQYLKDDLIKAKKEGMFKNYEFFLSVSDEIKTLQMIEVSK
jgi:hypothetical protein